MHRFALLGAGFIGSVHATSLTSHPRVDFVPSTTSTQTEPTPWPTSTGRGHGRPRRRRSTRTASTPSSSPPPPTPTPTTCAAPPMPDLLCCARSRSTSTWTGPRMPPATPPSRGIPAMVDFNRRFDRDYAEAQTSGHRRARSATSSSSSSPVADPSMPPLSYIAVSGGQMRDQTVHFFDFARWISGLDPVEVYAAGSALAEPRLADTATSTPPLSPSDCPTGALVQIDNARRIGYGYDERIEVLGSTGMIEARRQRTGSVSRLSGGLRSSTTACTPAGSNASSPRTPPPSTTSYAAG